MANHEQNKRANPKAILFDMDGTLTEPMLDFPGIKAEMRIGSRPILEALEEMSEIERDAAMKVLLRHEEEAAERSTLNPGCEELLGWLGDRGIASALITRNSRQSVQTVLRRHRLSIGVLVAREDGPFKPSPEPLHSACRQLQLQPAEVWMVGDGQFDVEAGHAAGIKTVWVSHRRARFFAAEPWKSVADLHEFLELLKLMPGGETNGWREDLSEV